MINAARYEPVIWTVKDFDDVDRSKLGLKGSPTVVGKMFTPPKPEGAKMLEGTIDEQVKQVIDIMMEREELFFETKN